jgi:O-antigen ligase
MEIASKPSFELTKVKISWQLPLLLLVVFAVACPFDLSESGGRLTAEQDTLVSQVETGNTAREVALLCLGVWATVALFRRKRSYLRVNGLLGWSMIFYVGLALASPTWAEDPSLAIRRAGLLLVLSLSALATVVRLSQIRTAALAVCVCGSTLVISVVAELAAGTFNPLDESWRFSGVLHPVTQGWNCGLLTIASLALARALPRCRGRFIFFALVAFLFLGLTRSRMPVISTIIAGGVLGTFTSLTMRKLTFALTYVVLVFACLFWLVLFALGRNMSGTVESIAAMGRGQEAMSSLDTFTGRLPLWEEELKYVRARPILGYGYNAFLNPSNLLSVSDALGWVPTSAHSGYIGTLLGLGYVGAATFVLVLVLALKRSLSLARGSPNTEFAAAVTIWLCCNLFLESTVITEPTFPTFICLVSLASLAFQDSSRAHRSRKDSSEHGFRTITATPDRPLPLIC